MSALGQKQTHALRQRMSALPLIATAKADIRKRSCLLYPRKRTCAVQLGMSALGQKRTSPTCADERFLLGPASPKIREKYRSSTRPQPDGGVYVTCGVNVRSHLEKTRSPHDRSSDHHTVRIVPCGGPLIRTRPLVKMWLVDVPKVEASLCWGIRVGICLLR